MTPNPFLSKEDMNDDDYFFYEIPSMVIHLDDNACERKKNFTGTSLEMMMRYWIPIPFNIISQAF